MEYGMTGPVAWVGLFVAIGVFGFVLYKLFWGTERGAELLDEAKAAKAKAKAAADRLKK